MNATKKSPVSFQSIESDLDSILETLNDIPNINKGGCGISALSIYRWCKKQRLKVSDRPFVFLWWDDDEYDAQENDSHLYNGELDDVEVPPHVIIELQDGRYDSEGHSNNFEPFTVEQEYRLNEEELLAVVNNSGWNSWFRRDRNIPVIEAALGIDLSDVDL